ncbi:MAG TPA: tetratricopeptide repeat protein, partial [Blastocatellia bacterium]|nr:tetratricopeptide repeat protein [Blastocatellia bacterium]
MKRTVLIALLFVFGCSFNSGAAQEMSVARGRELLKQGNYKEALSVFVTLLEKNELDRDAFEGRILCQLAVGQYEAAENRTKVYLQENQADTSLRVLLGEIKLETGRYAEADAEFDRASREVKPGVVWLRARFGRIRALAAQGKDDDLRTTAQEFARYYNDNSPRSAEELTLIGSALVYIEKFKDANELFIDAREADPTFIDAFIAQGELLNEKYNYGEAASLFEDALKINPNSPRALVGRARSKAFAST